MYLNFVDLKAKLLLWQPELEPGKFIKINWQLPTEPEHGILTTNIAFSLAKTLRQDPNLIAQNLEQNLKNFVALQKLPLEISSKGAYVNVRFSNTFYLNYLKKPFSFSGNLIAKSESKIVFDYVGANVAKRLHAGHMRNLNLGDSLRRVLKLKYPNLLTDNHWGDWGVQFGILVWGWKQIIELKNSAELSLNIEDYNQNPISVLQKIYVWANSQEEKVANWKDLVRQEFFKLEQGDTQNRKLWENFVKASKEDLTQDLKLMNVPIFDLEQGESFYESDMRFLTDFMDKHKIWKQENEARYFDFEEMVKSWTGLEQDRKLEISKLGRSYLISSNGYTTYCFRDVAARLQWARDHEADLMLTITDKTQEHNFNQAFAIICYLASLDEFKITQKPETIEKIKFKNLIYIGYGFLSLSSGKMSARKGNFVTLRDLVQEVKTAATENLKLKSDINQNLDSSKLDQKASIIAVAALKWFDLNRDSWNDIVLDIPQILQFEGNTGVYQLYTYARLKSILRKNKDFDIDSNSTEENLVELKPIEIIFLQQIYSFPDILEKVIENYKPHLICNHLYSLCDQVNKWYSSTPILKEENPNRKEALILLVSLICNHLKHSLNLLGIEVLEEM